MFADQPTMSSPNPPTMAAAAPIGAAPLGARGGRGGVEGIAAGGGGGGGGGDEVMVVAATPIQPAPAADAGVFVAEPANPRQRHPLVEHGNDPRPSPVVVRVKDGARLADRSNVRVVDVDGAGGGEPHVAPVRDDVLVALLHEQNRWGALAAPSGAAADVIEYVPLPPGALADENRHGAPRTDGSRPQPARRKKKKKKKATRNNDIEAAEARGREGGAVDGHLASFFGVAGDDDAALAAVQGGFWGGPLHEHARDVNGERDREERRSSRRRRQQERERAARDSDGSSRRHRERQNRSGHRHRHHGHRDHRGRRRRRRRRHPDGHRGEGSGSSDGARAAREAEEQRRRRKERKRKKKKKKREAKKKRKQKKERERRKREAERRKRKERRDRRRRRKSDRARGQQVSSSASSASSPSSPKSSSSSSSVSSSYSSSSSFDAAAQIAADMEYAQQLQNEFLRESEAEVQRQRAESRRQRRRRRKSGSSSSYSYTYDSYYSGSSSSSDAPREVDVDMAMAALPSHLITAEDAAKAAAAEEVCTICLGPFEEGDNQTRLLCFHAYHAECVAEWLKRSPLCPICKQATR